MLTRRFPAAGHLFGFISFSSRIGFKMEFMDETMNMGAMTTPMGLTNARTFSSCFLAPESFNYPA